MLLGDCLLDHLHSTEAWRGHGAAISGVHVAVELYHTPTGEQTHAHPRIFASLGRNERILTFNPTLHCCSDAADYSVSQLVSRVFVIKRPKAFSAEVGGGGV